MTDRPQAFLPNERETLLLRACLLTAPDAAAAWARLQPFDLDHADVQSYRMVPLLYRNLLRHGIEAPDRARLKGIYRSVWVRNQLLMRDVARVLAGLRTAAVPTILLKGAALAPVYYGDLGVRPMNDFDILVPHDRVTAAIDVLEHLGWSVPTKRWLPYSLHHGREYTFRKPDGFACDLHWLLLEQLVLPDAPDRSNDDFWEAAEPLEIRGEPTRILAPADQLLHVCVHGPVYYSDAHVCWAADAYKILDRAGAEFDWDRLVAQAIRRGAVVPVRDALAYLDRALQAPVPAAVHDSLQRAPTTRRVERAYRFPPAFGGRGRVSQALGVIAAYRWWTAAWPRRRVVAAAPGHFARLAGVWVGTRMDRRAARTRRPRSWRRSGSR